MSVLLQSSKKWVAGDGRFEDNGDGTVMDHKTGLIWLQNATAFDAMNWAKAIEVASTLRMDTGYSHIIRDDDWAETQEGEWRLPTLSELKSLCFDDVGNLTKPGAPFTGVLPRYYWTSSANSDDPTDRWFVSLVSGGVFTSNKSVVMFVWPVRNGQ